MNWLITGGCGFIGRNLIRKIKLVYPSSSIRIIDDLSVGTIDDLAYTNQSVLVIDSKDDVIWTPQHLQLIKGTIVDPSLALKCTKQADIIVHLAANTGVGPSVENPRLDCTTNIIGTFNYLEACRHNSINKFVFASSGAPIGDCTPPIHEELACHPISPYGASKLAGEGYCSAYHKSYGIETVALRFGNAYGPGLGHKNSIVAKFIRQAMNGEVLEIYGDGSQTRDFIYVDDITEAIISASILQGVGGEVFQIATNRETTVLELAELLVNNLSAHGIKNIQVAHGPQRIGDAQRNFSDTSKAKKILNWTNQFRLEDGLNQTISNFI